MRECSWVVIFLALHSIFTLLLSHKEKVFVSLQEKLFSLDPCSCFHLLLCPLLPSNLLYLHILFGSPFLLRSLVSIFIYAQIPALRKFPWFFSSSYCVFFFHWRLPGLLFKSTTSSPPNHILTSCLWFPLSQLIKTCTLSKSHLVTSFSPDACLLLIYIFPGVPP